jgi:hypothetical protein
VDERGHRRLIFGVTHDQILSGGQPRSQIESSYRSADMIEICSEKQNLPFYLSLNDYNS